MPGLLRGVARTAVVAGTASAVSGRVARRQAEHFADRDAQIMATRSQGWQEGAQAASQQQPQYVSPPPPAPAPSTDTIRQLKDLAELKNQGILTDAEFDAQKAKILG